MKPRELQKGKLYRLKPIRPSLGFMVTSDMFGIGFEPTEKSIAAIPYYRENVPKELVVMFVGLSEDSRVQVLLNERVYFVRGPSETPLSDKEEAVHFTRAGMISWELIET